MAMKEIDIREVKENLVHLLADEWALVTAGRLNVIDGVLTAPSVGKAVVRSDGKTSLSLFDQKTATSATASPASTR